MLTIYIQSQSLWDEKAEKFIEIKGQVLVLEHSLVSISKWESRWKKPFISKVPKTEEEFIDYVKCMTITQNVSPETYFGITSSNINEIKNYINDPMTATWFSQEKIKSQIRNNRVVTSELIYYWMIALNIPVEFQKWHLNRLITLIKVCNLENKPKKKIGSRAIMSRNAGLNAARRKRLNSKG